MPIRQLWARADLLLVLLLVSFALWPLLQRPGLPNGTDTLYHVYRAAEMDRSWANGVLLPRWAESFYFGYGSPLFHYYASFTYYLTSVITRLTGWDAVNSLRAVVALSVVGAGGGMYVFMRARAGALSGVIAAAAYVYSPYLLYKEPYARGDFPELLAFAVFPVCMWVFERLLRRGGGLAFVLAALSVAVLINTHNLMALVLTALLGAWLLWNGLDNGWRRAGLALAALLLGIGLAAAFWLPVILERDAVQLANLVALAELDFRNFFIPLERLLEGVPRMDGGAVNGLLPVYRLGVMQWVLALMGLVVGIIVQRRMGMQRTAPLWMTLFFAVMGAVFVFMVTPLSDFIWNTPIPFSLLQFPWRFMGPAAFCLAVLAGLNGLWIEKLPRLWGAATVTGALVGTIVLVLPLLYIPEWTNTQVDSSITGYHDGEISGFQLATTYSGEFLPDVVQVLPNPTQRLLDDYADGYPVDHAHREALPEGVTLELVTNGPQLSEWRVRTPEAFTLEVLIFAFEGWQAQINGQRVPITPADPHGMITFEIPPGEHEVRVFLGSTPARDAGRAITFASAFVVVAAVVVLVRYRQQRPIMPPYSADTLRPLDRYAVLGAVALVIVVWALWMRPGGAWLESPPGQALAAQNPADFRLGDSVRVLGYDLNGRDFRPGDRLELNVYWYTSAPIPYGYSSFVHVSSGGPPLAQADKLNPAGRPTRLWVSSGYYRDSFVIELPADMPPGEYQLTTGLYTCDTRPAGECGNGERLPVSDADGNTFGDTVPLGAVTVR